MPLFRRRGKQQPVLASAAGQPIGDRKAAERQRRLRQAWQHDAWAYFDAIGEIRYPLEFMANAVTRMRIYPAMITTPDEPPTPLDEADGVPGDFRAAAYADLAELGHGQLGLRPLLHDQYINNKIAGEMWLVGNEDPDTGAAQWRIRSIDEVDVNDRGVFVRDDPAATLTDWTPLDPESSYLARLWRPHPRFDLLATSPMRAILDSCEELLLLSRSIRGTARSRLAGNGLLLLAQEVSLMGVQESDDPEADPFFEELTRAMLTPISEEGDASSVVPIVARVPGEYLKDHKVAELIRFDRPFDGESMKLREELIGRIATGLDLPKEVVTGVVDLNHWTAWQVDDNTFRHHIEPDVINQIDDLTVAYGRPMLAARGTWDPALIGRLTYWYDPVELVTHPDRTQDAMSLHDKIVISDAALAKVAGFSEDDVPSPQETLLRMFQHSRTFPPNVVEALIHRIDPSLVIPADRNEPGETPAGTTPPLDTQPPPPGDGAPTGPPVGPNPPEGGAGPTTAAAAPTDDSADETLVAAARPARRGHEHASRQLVDLDRQLRARLLSACDAAVRRQLERAGARLRSRAQHDPTVRASLAAVPQHFVAATLGRDQVSALGVTDTDLVDRDWADLHAKWDSWVAAAQKRARLIAASIVGVDVPDDLEQTQDTARSAGWDLLAAGLSTLTLARMYDPSPDAPPLGEHDPNVTVPTSLVREAIATAGSGPGVVDVEGQAAVDIPAGAFGIGNGEAITSFLLDGGAEADHRVWLHGDVEKVFEPHLDLDGYEFVDFDDPGLANTSGWPEVEFYAASDHEGCGCDWQVVWATGGVEEPVAAAGNSRVGVGH